MAKRNSGRRGRSRSRRGPDRSHAGKPAAGEPAASTPSAASTPAAATKARPRPRRSQASSAPRAGYRDPGGVGDRPEAPWHPWPFSELLILIGAIGTIVGFLRGAAGRPVLFAGLGAVMLGTLEFTIREHRAGYRAHTAMLAAIPTAIVHSAAALALYALGAPRVTWIIVPLALDLPVFWFLFRTLRGTFQDARRERVFELSRR